MKRLYIETNFLMSVCTGRDAKAASLLDVPSSVQIALPVVCMMEARKAFAAMKYAKVGFQKPFEDHARDVGRDGGANAQEFKTKLSEAGAALTRYVDESEIRLDDAITRLARRALFFSSPPGVLSRERSLRRDPSDDMVLGSILSHAEEDRAPAMAFLSEDADFERPTVAQALKTAGIVWVRNVEAAMIWVGAC